MPSQTFNKRRLVGILPERTNVSDTEYPGHYPNKDFSWNLSNFKKKLNVKIQRLSDRSIEFDIVGVDASIANAFRRILINDCGVPTVYIESVYIWDNTVVVGEVLAQRCGLVPLNVDPSLMIMKKSSTDQAMDRNTVVFQVDLTCERNSNAPKGSTKDHELYINHEVLSSHLLWAPAGEQAEVFAGKPPAPTNPNIVLTKLRPGQRVNMELHAVKGVGKDHAKFSPVATASYRLLPHIKIKKPIPFHLAQKFQKRFSSSIARWRPHLIQAMTELVEGSTMSSAGEAELHVVLFGGQTRVVYRLVLVKTIGCDDEVTTELTKGVRHNLTMRARNTP